jgi:CheY-like chemotaxis protein
MKSYAEKAPIEPIQEIPHTTLESPEVIKKRVLFIDDEPVFLNALGILFEGENNVVFAECHSVADAIKAIGESSPDIIFLDNTFSGFEGETNAGLIVADKIKASGQKTEIYSTSADVGFIRGGDPTITEEYEKRNIKHVSKNDLDKIISIVSGKKEKE